MNYTKGEWKVEQKDEKHGLFFGFTLSVKTKDLIIALCDRDKWDHKKERLVNAHLIAAAPDMYEALLSALGAIATLDSGKGWVKEISGIIQKALAKAAGKDRE